MLTLPPNTTVKLKNVINQLGLKAEAFRFVFIQNVKDELGNPVIDLMKPRYICFYGRKKGAVDQAIYYMRHLLENTFDFVVSDEYGYPSEAQNISNETMMLMLSFMSRSRFICAEDFIKLFMEATVDVGNVYSPLMKSTLSLKIRSHNFPTGKSYEATWDISPRFVEINNKGKLLHTNVIDAVESLAVASYKHVVDVNFDTLRIDYDGKLSPEFQPVETSTELVDLFRKSILDSSNIEV